MNAWEARCHAVRCRRDAYTAERADEKAKAQALRELAETWDYLAKVYERTESDE